MTTSAHRAGSGWRSMPGFGLAGLAGLVALLLLSACAATPAEDETGGKVRRGEAALGQLGEWPQWRGPERDGSSLATGLAAAWEARAPALLWRRPLGEGFSAISVADGRAFTLFADKRREYLIALDGEDGHELWRHDLGPRFSSSQGNGPRSTPAVSAGVVFGLSGSGGLHAVDAADGHLLWHRELGEPPLYGYASSPLVEEDLVVVHGRLPSATRKDDTRRDDAAEDDATEDGATVLALDTANGDLVWSAASGEVGYASPLAATLGGRRQIVSFLGSALVGLAASSGETLWTLDWPTRYAVNAADPVLLSNDRIFLSSSYDMGGALLRIGPDLGEDEKPEVLWTSRQMKNHFNSSVVSGEHLFGFDHGTLRCLAVDDGASLWRQRGFGKGSLLLADDHLLVLGDDGTLALVEAMPAGYREKGRIQVLEGRTFTPPTLAGMRLFVRDQREVASYDLGAASAGATPMG